jgi:hypothetical protein
MIKFKTDIKTFSIPSSWLDLKFSDYLELMSIESPIDQVKKLTGLNDFELSSIDLQPILECLSFLKEDIDDIEPNNYVIDDVLLPNDIGELSFEKKINVTDAIANNDIIETIRIYSNVDVSNHNCYDVFGNYKFIVSQVEEIVKKESELLKSTVTFEQQRAGIDEFDKLGHFNTIDMIAEKYTYTHSEVEQLPYNLVFLILLKSNISAKFEQRYSKIINEKK